MQICLILSTNKIIWETTCLSYDKTFAIQDENNYYPFSLKHIGGSTISSNYKYKYKYNSKELQDELGLNFYDYGARNYDPALGRWMNVDPLAEKSRRYSPYVYALNNPVFFIDPDGMMALPPDDHFDSSGNFMYKDSRETNNIVIHTGVVNLSQGNDEVQLKDVTFNSFTYSVLSNIADHYTADAGVDLDKVHNGKISIADEVVTGHKGGQPQGYVGKYNDGTYAPKSLDGSEALMVTSPSESKITIQLSDGKIHPLLNDANNFTSTLDHEGGKMGHLINPDKKHSDIYKDQIKKYSEKVTPAFNQLMIDNLKYYKARKE